VATNFVEFRRDIVALLQTLRLSLDRPYRDLSLSGADGREKYTRAMLLVEEARIKFNSYVRQRHEPTEQEWHHARDIVLKFLNTLLHSPDVEPEFYQRRFRIPSPRIDRENLSSLTVALSDGDFTIGEAIIRYIEAIENSRVAGSIQIPLDFGELVKIVPRQQVAPAKFEIVDSRIVISDGAPKRLEEDTKNIDAALDHIVGTGKNLIESLEQSNCDRRLLESVKELHKQVTQDGNIVKLGLTNLACGVMCSQFERELPDALCATFNSYNTSISMYVAQFPEWEQFTQRAASIEIDDESIVEIDLAASEVIEALEAQPELADPEVPKTIKLVRELMSHPGKSAKRAAFAMLKTIENLVSSIVRHSIVALNKTAEKTVEAISSAAAQVITGLLSIALIAASGIGPAAVNAGAPWVDKITATVREQIEALAKP